MDVYFLHPLYLMSIFEGKFFTLMYYLFNKKEAFKILFKMLFGTPGHPAASLCPSYIHFLWLIIHIHLLSYEGLSYTNDLFYNYSNLCGKLSAIPYFWAMGRKQCNLHYFLWSKNVDNCSASTDFSFLLAAVVSHQWH